MIPIVDDYLNDLIVEKLGYLKSNPNYIDKIINTRTDRLSRLKNFISAKPIKVIKGYPRTPAELPCICIMLSGEEETQDSLGDYGDDEIELQSTTESVTVMPPDNVHTNSYFVTSNLPVVNISQILINSTGVEIDPELAEEYSPDTYYLPDDIASPGDILTISYTYGESIMTSTEVMYESTYRLEVWTDNGDLTVELYHLLKWALLSGRSKLIEDYDIFRQTLSGADFEPVPNYFPAFVYRRALSFWCQFIATAMDDNEYKFIQDVESDQSYFSEGW